MTDLDDEAGRNFEGLSAHETQEALAEELTENLQTTEEDMTDENDEAAEEAEGVETETEQAVWTAAQMAEHARMAEALLFAAADPLDEATIAERLPEGAALSEILETLRAQYENRGVVLAKTSGKWRFVTAADVAHILEIKRVEPRKLSRAALETLAIIAYHQPCTRADIEDVRGVAVSIGSLDQLLEIGWVRLRGRRRNVPGRPILYGTTPKFLEHFSLETVGDLPGMADLKAAGLLDARLPPGFSVPSPTEAGEDEEDDMGEDDTEFSQDFLEEEDA